MRGTLPTRLSLALLSLFASGADAERWDFTPTLSLREIYSDNIGLAEDNPKSDWVTEITPGFSLRGQNDVLRASLTASSQNLFYREGSATDGDKTQSNPQVQLQSTTTLIPNFFFLDVGGNAGQRIVSQNNQLSYDNIALAGDRTDYSAYTIAPYIKYKSRAGINLEARAERGVNRYDAQDPDNEDPLDDAVTENYRFVLDNAGMQSTFGWRLFASRRYLDRDSDELSDPDFRQAQLDASYQLSGSLALIGRAGRYENTLGGIENERNGDYSAGGFRWSPSRRFSLAAMAGSNYNDAELNWKPSRRTDMMLGYRDTDVGLITGPSWRSNVRVRGRRFHSTLSYSEEVTTEQQLVLENETVTVIDPVTGQPIDFVIGRFAIANDEFERHRGSLALGWRGRSGDITLTLSKEDRTYLLSEDLNSTSESAGLSVKWPIAGGLDLISLLRGQRSTFSQDAAEENFRLASLGVRMNFSSRTYAGLSIQHAEQDSERDARSYEEGRVIAELNMRF